MPDLAVAAVNVEPLDVEDWLRCLDCFGVMGVPFGSARVRVERVAGGAASHSAIPHGATRFDEIPALTCDYSVGDTGFEPVRGGLGSPEGAEDTRERRAGQELVEPEVSGRRVVAGSRRQVISHLSGDGCRLVPQSTCHGRWSA